MKTAQITIAAAASMAILLACGGVVPGGQGGSEQARTLCDFYSAQHEDVPCQPLGVGDVVKLVGWEITVVEVFTIHEDDFPGTTRSRSDRVTLDRVDGNLMVIIYEVKNTKPIRASASEYGRFTLTGAGNDANCVPQMMETYAETRDDLEFVWSNELAAGQTARSAWVVPILPEEMPHSTFLFFSDENRIDTTDPRGRTRDFWNAFAVVDLGIPGPPPPH